MNPHPAFINAQNLQIRPAIGILYFVSKVTPGIEREPKNRSENHYPA